MRMIHVKAGPFSFRGELHTELAPITCAEFQKLLPYTQKLIQARWSGESGWVPLGTFELKTGLENQLSHPLPGQILFYPSGISETEILFPYGQTAFACKAGPLKGNHFLTLTQGLEQLPELGRLLLWKGSQDVVFAQI